MFFVSVGPRNGSPSATNVILVVVIVVVMSPLRRHIFVCFMAKSAFWRGFSALSVHRGRTHIVLG